MVPWLVIDRRHLPRTPRGPRHRLSPVYPERPVQRAPTPGLHVSGVQIEAQPQLWDADSNVLGVLTAVLPFTNHSPLTCSEPVGAAAHFSFKSFTCNTYGLSKSFICNSYKKHGGRMPWEDPPGPSMLTNYKHPRMLILRSPPRRTTKDLFSHPTTIDRTATRKFSYLGTGPMRRRLIRIALILLLFPPLLAAAAGWLSGPAFLHPIRRHLTPDLIREADASFAVTGATREDFDVRAPDGAPLRGWKVRPKNPNGSWVLLFHGVADNRIGVVGLSEFLLRAGYSVVMMDIRAHGASGGPIATYGWLERSDTRAIVDALLSSEHVGAGLAPPASSFSSFASSTSLTSTSSTSLTSSVHLFALGESMGAGIALKSAAGDPRIEAVVAEASFADLREGAYDYAALRIFPWLGKTLFAPGAWALLYRA